MDLERIFLRYYTDGPKPEINRESEEKPPQFGIALWIVRRNLEALGDSAHAESISDAGLGITLQIPLAI